MIRKEMGVLLLGILLASLQGCRTTTHAVAPSELGAGEVSDWVTVERVEGEPVRIRNAIMDETHLSGQLESGETIEIPATTIRSVRIENTRVSLLAAIVPVAGVAIWLVQAEASAPSPPPSSSSCPFIYVDNGEGLIFQAEPYGAAIAPALKRMEWTPLPQIRAVGGEYRVRISNELDETQHTDEVRLLVVDHPPGTEVAADPSGEILVFSDPVPPREARDGLGNDLTPALQEADAQAWMSEYGIMDAAVRETLKNPLVVEFPKPPDARTAKLLVNGATSPWGAQVAKEFLALRGRQLPEWYANLANGGPALISLLAWFAREGLYMLPIEVETPSGWEPRGTLYGSGPFAYKSTAYALDVSDIPGETLRIRFPTPVNFWVFNSVAVDYGQELPFDVVEVETSTVRDARGRAVRSLLAATDDSALVMGEKGDYSDLAFPTPPERAGRDRTVLLKISGHYDIHLPAEGEPQEALLRKVLLEPGYTLEFAFSRHQQQASATGTKPGG